MTTIRLEFNFCQLIATYYKSISLIVSIIYGNTNNNISIDCYYPEFLVTGESGINVLKATISSLEKQINSQAQSALRNELEIIGVTETPNENLQHIILQTASKIGVSLTCEDHDWVMRPGNSYAQGTQTSNKIIPRPLIVKFMRRAKREDFLKAAKTRRNITSADIEIQGPARKLYFNEHLTKHNRLFFRDTRSRAKESGYKYCWIKNGIVHIRKHEGRPAIKIRNLSDMHHHLGLHDENVSVCSIIKDRNK
ncbi:uncharacterized protein LOC131847119 [Achroia grisella]|uniref:uncharacterized protein LOC131847119 n=1 Tax=Achroia grisella TaxID=688607 RepID=UPI0027D31D29|nr:uncharacterized protein LOC131847119 [Achroia grisella]